MEASLAPPQPGLETLFPREEEIPAELRPAPIEQRFYLADGELRPWEGALQRVFSPIHIRRGQAHSPLYLGSVPRLGEAQALEALQAARTAFTHGPWPRLAREERLRGVETFLAELRRQRRQVVHTLMWEVGKNLSEARAEFDRTLEHIENALALLRDKSSTAAVEAEGIRARLGRAPRGVVLCLGPSNVPLNETLAPLLTALMTGNTAIVKPPRHGILLFAGLLEPLRETFPPGVVNVIYGEEQDVLRPLMASGAVDVLALVGSSASADRLLSWHPAPRRLHTLFGLEAKNAAIVLPDADMEQAVRECLLGALAFNGQRCTALKLIFVHRSVVNNFLGRLLHAIKRLKCGMPWEKGVWITPLADPARPAYLHELIADARSRGAEVLNPQGGSGNASYMHPALIYPVRADMRLFHEEQFGPLVPVADFEQLDAPLAYLEKSPYGQQVSLFGSDPATLAPLVERLSTLVCRINLNCKSQRGPDSFPFAGRGDSGVGSLAVADTLAAFTHPAVVATRSADGSDLLAAVSNHARFLKR